MCAFVVVLHHFTGYTRLAWGRSNVRHGVCGWLMWINHPHTPSQNYRSLLQKDLQKRPIFCKETNNFKEPTNCKYILINHPHTPSNMPPITHTHWCAVDRMCWPSSLIQSNLNIVYFGYHLQSDKLILKYVRHDSLKYAVINQHNFYPNSGSTLSYVHDITHSYTTSRFTSAVTLCIHVRYASCKFTTCLNSNVWYDSFMHAKWRWIFDLHTQHLSTYTQTHIHTKKIHTSIKTLT